MKAWIIGGVIFLTITVVSTGCEYVYTRWVLMFSPELGKNITEEEWDGSKGEFPPGRILKSDRV